MGNSYILGRSREHNLLNKLRKNDWFAIRGSGSKAGMVLVDGKKYFPIGQPVWFHDPTTKAGVYHKLSPN